MMCTVLLRRQEPDHVNYVCIKGFFSFVQSSYDYFVEKVVDFWLNY
jgi:hypothetical protein